ncbi:hypothetical protein M1N08_01080, partial [Dehalococcoidia bacterium]|nr:hypothetical protein [Dehalococcoidia bacterium]
FPPEEEIAEGKITSTDERTFYTKYGDIYLAYHWTGSRSVVTMFTRKEGARSSIVRIVVLRLPRRPKPTSNVAGSLDVSTLPNKSPFCAMRQQTRKLPDSAQTQLSVPRVINIDEKHPG